jgi:Phosphatidylethanolamine-binding protein
MRQFPQALGFAAVLVLTSMHEASAFGASFSWSGIGACGRTSPAFTIHDAPKETASLRFRMNDKDAPNFQHGGSTIPYNGSGGVPAGTIDYIGPCPPAGTTLFLHRDGEAGEALALGEIACVEDWEQFSDEWETICDQPQKTPKFHMTRARRKNGKRVPDLADLVCKRTKYRVDAVMSRQNYDKFVKSNLARAYSEGSRTGPATARRHCLFDQRRNWSR